MTLGRAFFLAAWWQMLVCSNVIAQTTQPQFGAAYSEIDARRQQLINQWVSRFEKTTGQDVEPAVLYDQHVNLSTKTTFDAVTHALLTTRLTDSAGASMGDALDLVVQVEAVRGEVNGAKGDRQFRMYAQLAPGALDRLARSQEFKRGHDNTVFHKGYPINYRGQGNAPSIQISVALDGSRADIDVDYRSSGFPAALFNGHLTSSNSDVRAGNNYDKHLNRWTGFQNWWNSFFGVRMQLDEQAPDASRRALLPATPRAGKKTIDVMVNDFLTAWLVEGDVAAAMGYVSDRSYACLAQDSEAPTFDRGMAPFQVMMNLKAAYDTLGPHASLDGLVVGTRLTTDGLRVVQQPHGARFVAYSVPDDIAATLDCESRLQPGDPSRARREYGDYFGSTFYVAGRRDVPVALLWAKVDGYWKIVSWKTGADDESPAPEPVAEPKVARIAVDPSLALAARDFLDLWLIKKQYDAAFGYLSPLAYGCYDLERDPAAPASTSAADAGAKLRAALVAASAAIGTGRKLDQIIEAVEPVHAAVRVMDHPAAKTFSLTSVPDALADAAECSARAKGSTMPDPMPLEYGKASGTTIRFKTRAGEAPILRLLWHKEDGRWRITSYGIELP